MNRIANHRTGDSEKDEVSNDFRPELDSYNGPLDLLLYLIKKDEVDVFDIPIARVVGQFRAYLAILQSVDPNSCGDFLVMAANLMEIKSKLLLPREQLEEESELEDPRLELVQQLLEYKKYKERALLLEDRFREFSQRHHRPSMALPMGELPSGEPVDLGNVDVWDLLTAFHRIQIALAQRGPVRVVLQDRPIEEYVAMVEESLLHAPNRTAEFESLFLEAPGRVDAIGVLLAILEMAKDRRIAVFQESFGSPIEVRLHGDAEVAELRALDEEDVLDDTEAAESLLLQGEGQEALREPVPESPGPEAAGPEAAGPEAAGPEAAEDADPPDGPAAGEPGSIEVPHDRGPTT